MTCLEAQSNIMAFIDKKLPEENISDFVRHIRYCKNCSEELEIYYTLIVGTRQLDNDGELSHDFKKDLNHELDRIDSKVKKARRFKTSSTGIILITLVVLAWFVYAACLAKVYRAEQKIIKSHQGDRFISGYFGDYIELSNIDFIAEKFTVQVETAPPTVFERIHHYNKINNYDWHAQEEKADDTKEDGY